MLDIASAHLLEKNPSLGFLINWIDVKKKYDKENISIEIDTQPHVEAIFLYGVEIFHHGLEVVKWLEQTSHHLILLEEDHQKIKLFLESDEAIRLLELDNVLFFSPIYSGYIEESLLLCIEQCPIANLLFFSSSTKTEAKDVRQKLIHLLLIRRGEIAEHLCLDNLFVNLYNNIQQLPTAKSIYGMKNACKNIPAVICGAGPSLKNHIEQLKSLQDKAFIFAGGSTIAALNHHGIFPHVQVAADPTKKEYTILKGAYAVERPLLMELRTRFDIRHTTNGDVAFAINAYDQYFLTWLIDKLQMKEVFQDEMQSVGGSSVTMLCIDFAIWLGCNPICLVGVDLAYKDNKKYIDGAPVDQMMDAFLEEGKDTHIIVDEGVVTYKKSPGKNILTQNRWIMEAEEIEDKAKKYPSIQWMNLNEEGLGFSHIPFVSFKQIKEHYFSNTYDLDGIMHMLFQQAPTCTAISIKDQLSLLKESFYRIKVIYGECLVSNAISDSAQYQLDEEIGYLLFLSPLEKILKNKRLFGYSSKKIHALLLEKIGQLISIMEP
ncbi:MAG: motility associated factor glycosyltransferase family protein [Chlamydiales bacterium]|nr:motility associated factor glycosyltransferase family protein [Chlamydiales bacterium]